MKTYIFYCENNDAFESFAVHEEGELEKALESFMDEHGIQIAYYVELKEMKKASIKVVLQDS